MIVAKNCIRCGVELTEANKGMRPDHRKVQYCRPCTDEVLAIIHEMAQEVEA